MMLPRKGGGNKEIPSGDTMMPPPERVAGIRKGVDGYELSTYEIQI